MSVVVRGLARQLGEARGESRWTHHGDSLLLGCRRWTGSAFMDAWEGSRELLVAAALVWSCWAAAADAHSRAAAGIRMLLERMNGVLGYYRRLLLVVMVVIRLLSILVLVVLMMMLRRHS